MIDRERDRAINPASEIGDFVGRSQPEIFEEFMCMFRREHANERKWSIHLQLWDKSHFQIKRDSTSHTFLYADSEVIIQQLTPNNEKWDPSCQQIQVVVVGVPYNCKYPDPNLREGSESHAEALATWNRFSILATHAGSQLPQIFKDNLPSGKYSEPLENWLQLVFNFHLPDFKLEEVYGGKCTLSYKPFDDAAKVIEECKLHRHRYVLPPLLKKRKEGIDAIPKESARPKRSTNQGRKVETDPKEDQMISEAWGTGQYKKYSDLAQARGKGENREDIERAIDRHRHRSK